MLFIDLSARYPVNRRNWPYVVGAVGAVLLLALFVDAALSRYATGWPDPWRWFFLTSTELGDAYWILSFALRLILLSAALAFIIHDRLPRLMLIEQTKLWAFVFLGVALPSLVANLVKRTIGRSRPELLDENGILTFRTWSRDWLYESFPSGHATTIFALAMVVGFLKPRWFIAAVAVAAVVAFSRVPVGAHYLTDAIGGALLGTIGAYAVRDVFAWRGWLFRRTPSGRIDGPVIPATRELLSGRRDSD
jgi:membrane-associated phospholipid phosphatase